MYLVSLSHLAGDCFRGRLETIEFMSAYCSSLQLSLHLLACLWLQWWFATLDMQPLNSPPIIMQKALHLPISQKIKPPICSWLYFLEHLKKSTCLNRAALNVRNKILLLWKGLSPALIYRPEFPRRQKSTQRPWTPNSACDPVGWHTLIVNSCIWHAENNLLTLCPRGFMCGTYSGKMRYLMPISERECGVKLEPDAC